MGILNKEDWGKLLGIDLKSDLVKKMEFKIIRTTEQHEEYLGIAKKLIKKDPEIGTEDAETLDLLVLLIEN